jgi:hypothetical protein
VDGNGSAGALARGRAASLDSADVLQRRLSAMSLGRVSVEPPRESEGQGEGDVDEDADTGR